MTKFCILQVGGRYVALGDYEAVDVGEASLKEGENVEVEKVGCAGWWYIRVLDTTRKGWVPASYLGQPNGKSGSHSSPSVSSQGIFFFLLNFINL